MTPAEHMRRLRANPAYRAAENARNAARERNRRAQRRALTGRALRITFSDSLPSLVSIALRNLAGRPAPATHPDA
jgi:hypothetical protein